MLKKSLLLVLIPCLLFAGQVKKEYFFSAPYVDNGVIVMEGCRTSKRPFEPSVAVKPSKLLLPYGQEAVSFSVKYDEPVFLEGEYSIVPSRPGGRISGKASEDYYTRKSAVYDKNEFYPSSVSYEKFCTQYKHGHAIFVTILNPVQYNPATGEIRYHRRISIKVKTKAANAPPYKCTRFIKDQLRSLVDNPKAVSSLPLSSVGPDDYEYLVVTTDPLIYSFDNFIDFNKRRCLRTQVQTIDYIKSNVPGSDDADKLRNYISIQPFAAELIAMGSI